MERFLRSVDDSHNLKLFNSHGSNSFRTLEIGKMPSSNDTLFNAKLIREMTCHITTTRSWNVWSLWCPEIYLHVPHVHSCARSIGAWFLCFGLTNRSELCEESRSTNLRNTLKASQPESYITGSCLVITHHAKWQANKATHCRSSRLLEKISPATQLLHQLLWTLKEEDQHQMPRNIH